MYLCMLILDRLSKSRVFFLDYGGTLVKDTPTTAPPAPAGADGADGKVGSYDINDRSTRRKNKVSTNFSCLLFCFYCMDV